VRGFGLGLGDFDFLGLGPFDIGGSLTGLGYGDVYVTILTSSLSPPRQFVKVKGNDCASIQVTFASPLPFVLFCT
jgi:hypothetical protein